MASDCRVQFMGLTKELQDCLIRRGVVELAEKEKDLHVIYDPDGLFEGRDEVV